MQGTTLAIAVFCSILVLFLRPAYGLATYITILIWYPDYLRASIGTIDLSVGRIVIAVLLLRCLCDNRLRSRFVWSRLDTLVTLSMVVYVGIYCMTRPLLMAVENRGGFLLDTFFVYFTVRLIITDKQKLMSFVKCASIALAALAILGATECITHHTFFLQLKRYRPWNTPLGEISPQGRWGLARAVGPFSHSIMFGSCFVMFLPLIWALRYQRSIWSILAYPLSAIIIIGALSCMSSGPWVMLAVLILCLAFERFKRYVKPILITLVLSCVFIGFASNRPFYHVFYSYINPVGGQWYQRAKLVDYAIEDFDNWWLTGYEGRDPRWGGRSTDANNEFILAGINYGILGVAALCMVLAAAFRGLSITSKETTNPQLKSLYWSLGSLLVCIIIIWQGVSFFGQPVSLFYLMLGIIGSSLGFAKYKNPDGYRLVQANNYGAILTR
jgi:hypothetical protein